MFDWFPKYFQVMKKHYSQKHWRYIIHASQIMTNIRQIRLSFASFFLLYSITLTYLYIHIFSNELIHKTEWLNGLRLLSGNPEVVCSNLTRSNRIFCYFSLYALPFKLLFPYLPKGIFPFPFKHRQPQLSSNGKCKEKPGIPFWGWTPSLFLKNWLC